MKIVQTFLFITLLTHLIHAQETISIPDIGLEECLIDLGFDSNGFNGNILVSDVKYIVNLNINDPKNNPKLPNVHSKIKSLAGIEHFFNLKRLDCYGNDLTDINLSKNTELTFLNCGGNKLTTLDVSNNTKLHALNCDENNLNTLILGEKPALVDLYCNNNKLKELNISTCSSLENLDASNNTIDKITIHNTSYKKYSEGWFKDEATAYITKDMLQQSAEVATNDKILTPKKRAATNTTEKMLPNETSNNAASYYDKFKHSVITEYDNLILEPSHLQASKEIIAQKHKLKIEELSKWISEFANYKVQEDFLKAGNKNSSNYYTAFKKSAVAEYEKLLLAPSYIASKKQEIITKYRLHPEDFNKWIEQLGSIKATPKENVQEEPIQYYQKFKRAVVAEYQNLVLDVNFRKEKQNQIQKKYDLSAKQLEAWIDAMSSLIAR